jgi:hypothetical protein
MYASGRASIAICDRCSFKFPYQDLRADGNSPGLRVCEDCRDPKNPWRDPPIQPDAITLKFPRPDIPLTAGNVQYPDLTNVTPANSVPPNYNSYPTTE